MTTMRLADAVDALLAAMNQGREDDARALVRPDAWEVGHPSPAAMTADPTLSLGALPAPLEREGRAAVQVTGFHEDSWRASRWFFFEGVAEGWRLVGIGTTRFAAQRYLVTGETEPALPDHPAEGLGDEEAAAGPPAAYEGALREELEHRIFDVLRAHGIAPESVDDLSSLPEEQLEQLVPQMVGGAFQALFQTLLGRLKESLDEADARDPEVTVDLEEERAKRSGAADAEPSPFDDEAAREVRRALREALEAATDEHGEARVDADFVEHEAPRILGTLFGAVAKALAPAEVTLDLDPEPGHEDEGPTRVTLPIGELLGGLFAEAVKGHPSEPDEEE